MSCKPEQVYVCVVFHHSDLRPKGLEMANQFIDSWIESDLGYKLVILDNESTIDYPRLKEIDHIYIKVDNQNLNGGITGAWNDMIKEAYKMGAKIITGFADDVKINRSLKLLIDSVKDHDTVYVPLTDGMIDVWPLQKSDKAKINFIEEVDSINGFWMAFSNQFFKKRNTNGLLFDLTRKEIGKWSSQENALRIWNEKLNTKAVIIGDCWLHHTKLRSWTQARNKFDN